MCLSKNIILIIEITKLSLDGEPDIDKKKKKKKKIKKKKLFKKLITNFFLKKF